MCEIIKCFQCGDKMLVDSDTKKVDEGFICTNFCFSEYLMLGKSLEQLIEAHQPEVI